VSIVVTGALGFIGGNFVKFLNNKGFTDIIIVDYFDASIHSKLLSELKYKELQTPEFFFENAKKEDFVIHLGACSSTSNSLSEKHEKNYNEAINLIEKKKTNIIYASSAATYGNDGVNPLNTYGVCKKKIDEFAKGKDVIGLRFFNVYGNGEDNKGSMASMIYKMLHNADTKLFKYGEQLRDFVYVGDVVETIYYLMNNFNKVEKGTYDVGTGQPVSFYEVYKLIMNKDPEYIDMPLEIKKYFQVNTKADLTKLRKNGYPNKFRTIKEGIKEMRK